MFIIISINSWPGLYHSPMKKTLITNVHLRTYMICMSRRRKLISYNTCLYIYWTRERDICDITRKKTIKLY